MELKKTSEQIKILISQKEELQKRISTLETQVKEVESFSETTKNIIQDLAWSFSYESYEEILISVGKTIDKHVKLLEFNNKLTKIVDEK